VSNASFQKGGDSYGAIWLISGERLSTLPTHPYVEGQPPTELHLFVDPNAPGLYMLTGSTPGGLFGASLAMVPELGGSGRSALLIGSPVAESGGKVNTGGAFVYRYSMSDGGFDPIPMARVMGETYRPGSELGGSVLGVLQGSEGVVLLGSAYGTPFDQDDVIDNGSIYAAPLIAEP
jgi:hypothetical protein